MLKSNSFFIILAGLLMLIALPLCSAGLNIGINELAEDQVVQNYINISFNSSLSGGTLVGSLNITQNLIVTGNLSAKRPYWTGYDNSTQAFINLSASQFMNLSNNNDYDAYLVKVTNNQNITFSLTGDYLISVSPEFYQASGNNKIITFWIRKNGVDIPWSNSRYTIISGQYMAPAILYQIDISNPATDYINIMWYSDSLDTQIVSISGLTSPTRPSIPGVLLNVQKVSEITS